MNIINSPSIPLETHRARVKNFIIERLEKKIIHQQRLVPNEKSAQKQSCMLKTKCHLNNSSTEYEYGKFGRMTALGWEVCWCPPTARCANSPFAPVPRLPQAGSLKILWQWHVSKTACHGLLSHVLSLVIFEVKPSKSNNSNYLMQFKGAEKAEAKKVLVDQLI